MELTGKQKAFCYRYVENGYNVREAYKEAYQITNTNSLDSAPYQLIKKPAIKEYIKQIQKDRFEALNINADRVAEEVSKLAFAAFDENNTANSKLKALELLGKQLGLYTQKIDANVSGDIEINIEGD